MKTKRNLILIAILTALALVIDAPKNFPIKFSLFRKNYSFVLSSPSLNITWPFTFSRDLTIKQGLDLQGGTEVTIQADMSKIAVVDRSDALDAAESVITRRVDLYGVTEPSIKTVVTGGTHRIVVDLPGVGNPEQAVSLIGQTAHLDFREIPSATSSALASDFVVTNLSGSDLQKASVQFDSQSGQPEVALQFTPAGGTEFAAITARNVGKPLGIFLDGEPIEAPTVSKEIDGGQAVITGQFTLDQAKQLAITLNAGALPVPISIISQQNVAPSLGADSVARSLRAGAVGLGVVALFMILNYGWLGAIADFGLVIYGLLTLAIYKLVPITISLPGLAGFILSIGMAVDANILVFERMKEEIRKGSEWKEAMELGFGRAWNSIKDANVATLITSFVLYNPFDWSFLNDSGMVRGFALTLGLGIAISLFTGIFVTRNLLRALYKRS